jgi:hypothetical protein
LAFFEEIPKREDGNDSEDRCDDGSGQVEDNCEEQGRRKLVRVSMGVFALNQLIL